MYVGDKWNKCHTMLMPFIIIIMYGIDLDYGGKQDTIDDSKNASYDILGSFHLLPMYDQSDLSCYVCELSSRFCHRL